MSQCGTYQLAAILVTVIALMGSDGKSAVLTVPLGERLDQDLSDWTGAWLVDGEEVIYLLGRSDGRLIAASVLLDEDEQQFTLDQCPGFVTEHDGTRYVHFEISQGDDADETHYSVASIADVEKRRITLHPPNMDQFVAAVRAGELDGEVHEHDEDERVLGATHAISGDKETIAQFIHDSERHLFNEENPVRLTRIGAVEQKRQDVPEALAQQEQQELAEQLFQAILGNDEEGAIALVKQGAPVDALDHRDISVLHYAARATMPDLAEVLLENGADVHVAFGNDQQPIHWAARAGASDRPRARETIDVLLEYGADINAESDAGTRPITFAIQLGNEDWEEFLRSRGAVEVDPVG